MTVGSNRKGSESQTDRINARMLAEFAGMLVRRNDLANFIRPLADQEQQALAAMVTSRAGASS